MPSQSTSISLLMLGCKSRKQMSPLQCTSSFMTQNVVRTGNERSRLLANIKILAVLTSENECLQIRVLPSSSSLRKDWRRHHSGSGSGGLEGFVSDQRQQPCKCSKKCTEENVVSSMRSRLSFRVTDFLLHLNLVVYCAL